MPATTTRPPIESPPPARASSGANAATAADDPFAGLLDEPEPGAGERRTAAVASTSTSPSTSPSASSFDGAQARTDLLHDLFGADGGQGAKGPRRGRTAPARPRTPAPAPEATGGAARSDNGWPDHNYGPAYWGVHARSRRSRSDARGSPRRLWEVDDLLDDARHESPAHRRERLPATSDREHAIHRPDTPLPYVRTPAAAPSPETDAAAPGLPAWPAGSEDPLDWLATLDRAMPAPRTPARLVGVAAGDPLERWMVVVEAEELVCSTRGRHPQASSGSGRGGFLAWFRRRAHD